MSMMDWTNLVWFYSGGCMGMTLVAIVSMLKNRRDGLDYKDVLIVMFWPLMLGHSIIKRL